MTGKLLVENARKTKRKLAAKCSKFAGAAATEILRRALAREGIATSARDVFIRGIGLEVDLVITRRMIKPEMGLIYEPQDVAIALEVKKSGSYGKGGLEKLRMILRGSRESVSNVRIYHLKTAKTINEGQQKRNLEDLSVSPSRGTKTRMVGL